MSNLLGGEQSMLEKLMAAQERIAELEAECLRLKDVPMKYKRMEFNAQLQNQVRNLEAEVARLRVDAAIGAVVWKYIDRMNDVVPSDPAERILCEFCHAVQPVMDAAKESA